MEPSMNTTLESEMRIALDRLAIQEVLARYIRAVDRCDVELLKSVFHPDATDSHSGIYEGGIEGFCDLAIGVLREFGPVAHYLSIPLIEVDGDAALSEAYIVAFHRITRNGETFNSLAGARVLDRFERRNSSWRIAARRVVYDWNHDAPSSETWGKGAFGPVYSDSKKDRSDPLYEFLDTNHSLART
jgi:hypothetical protein